MRRFLRNPIRSGLLVIGFLLVRLGLARRRRIVEATDLAWPRIVTGIARMSKSMVDVAMVGIAIGPAAIAGVGFATPFWVLAFVFGGGIAGGTISLVSQRYGAGAHAEIDRAVKVSGLFVLLISVPLTLSYWFAPTWLISLIGSGDAAIQQGASYLKVVGLAVPLAGLNLICSRTLVGANDAWTPMVVRAGGAVANIILNAVLIFGFGLGVVGAALGTVIATGLVAVTLVGGLFAGRIPGLGKLPVKLSPSGPHLSRKLSSQLTKIATPLVLANLVREGGQFPLLAIVAMFGPNIVAAYVIAMRIRDFVNTPGWGFGLASSSLVGQALGTGREQSAEGYAYDTLRFTVAVYAAAATVVFIFAGSVGRLFVTDPDVLELTAPFIRVACISVVFWGITSGAIGPLRASGDTRWPFYGQVLGLFAFAIPIAYLGTISPLGVYALYLAIFFETAIPAAVSYVRLRTGRWKLISREFRPGAAR